MPEPIDITSVIKKTVDTEGGLIIETSEKTAKKLEKELLDYTIIKSHKKSGTKYNSKFIITKK